MPRFFILLSLFLLAACGEPALSRSENAMLREIRAYISNDAESKSRVIYPIVMENPEKLAKKAARAGDFRLIGLAMGYHAAEKDAFPFGVACAAPVEMKTEVFGCIPPPPVIFRQVMRYNVALARQPGFPAGAACMPDPRATESLEKMSAGEAAPKKLREKEQEPRLYNP